MNLEELLKEAESQEQTPKYSLKSVDSLEEEVRQALLKLLSRGSKSSSSLRKLLLEKEFPAAIVDQMIQRFIEVSLIDDFALARDLTQYAVDRKSKSKTIIARELREKGIPQDAIDLALSEIDQDSELENAKSLAESRMRQLLKLAPEVRQRRLVGFLTRKGYSSSVVWAAVRHADDLLT